MDPADGMNHLFTHVCFDMHHSILNICITERKGKMHFTCKPFLTLTFAGINRFFVNECKTFNLTDSQCTLVQRLQLSKNKAKFTGVVFKPII